MRSHIKKNFAVLSVLTAAGIILGYFENLLIPISMLPGIKLGLSNIVILYILVCFSKREAFFCGIIKAVITGMFSGGSGIIYSVCGIILAVVVMSLVFSAYKKGKMSEIGLSISGCGGFNAGQTAAACFMLSSFAPVYYLPVMLVFSVLSGAVTGFVCHILCQRIKVN